MLTVLIQLCPEKRIHQCPIPVIGLTGGIATGKTTVSQLFKERGIPVISADGLVKEIYGQKDSLRFIREKFPEAVVEGRIDFKILRKKAFEQNGGIGELETFLYQKMPDKFISKISKKRPNYCL